MWICINIKQTTKKQTPLSYKYRSPKFNVKKIYVHVGIENQSTPRKVLFDFNKRCEREMKNRCFYWITLYAIYILEKIE